MSWFRRSAKQAPTAAIPVAMQGALQISGPWARPDEDVAGQAGGYLAIANTGAEPDRLVSADCPLAVRTELHGIKVVGPDIQMMVLANGLRIGPDDTTTLKPRGYHLLLRGLRVPLKTGARLPVTLAFEKAGEVSVELVVDEPGLIGDEILHEEGHHG